MAWYDPGKQVVCVDDRPMLTNDIEQMSLIKKGVVYMVRDYYGIYPFYPNDAPAIYIEGVVRGFNDDDGVEIPFWVGRFRPVHPLRKSTEKGVQLLKDIAARKREPEGVEA